MIHVFPIPSREPPPLKGEKLFSLFSQADCFADNMTSKDPIVVLQEGTIDLREKRVPVILISEPLFIRNARKKITELPDTYGNKGAHNSKKSYFSSKSTSSLLQKASFAHSFYERAQIETNLCEKETESMFQVVRGHRRPNSIDSRNPLQRENLLDGNSIVSSTGYRSSNFIRLINRSQFRGCADDIRIFLKKFLQCPSSPSTHQNIIYNFIKMMKNQIFIHPISKSENIDLEDIQEGLEKLVTSKLFPYIFCPTQEEEKMDLCLKAKISGLNTFIEPKHLDLYPLFVKEEYLKNAINELSKINEFKSPRDKVICIMNCCKVAYGMLNAITKVENRLSAGADDFLPALLYIIIRSNTPNLYSNINYIRRFRHPSKLMSETGYYLTQFESALRFVEEADHKSFNVDETLWIQQMKTPGMNAITKFSSYQDPNLLAVGDIPALLDAFHSVLKENTRLKGEIEGLREEKRGIQHSLETSGDMSLTHLN